MTEQPIKKRAILFSVPKSENQTSTDNARSTQLKNVNVPDSVSSATVGITSLNPVIRLYDVNAQIGKNHSVTSNNGKEETKKTHTTENKSEGDNRKSKKYATLIPVKKTKE